MTSTRLPGKVMLPLAGEPVIRHVLRRCLRIPGIDTVICAVPDSPASLPITEEAMSLGVSVCLGPEDDVLTRYWMAAQGASVVMRVTADCPLIDPDMCAHVLAPVVAGEADYCSNVLPRSFPKGLDCEAFTFAVLERTHREAKGQYDREHVTAHMQRAPHWRRRNIGQDADESALNYCIDTPADYARLQALMGGA